MILFKVWTSELSTAGSSPYQIAKATVQAKMLSGRYRTARLMRHWSQNREGYCLLPLCSRLEIHEDIDHILVHCASLEDTRTRLTDFSYSQCSNPVISYLVQKYCTHKNHLFPQFLLDCSTIPEVITASQEYGEYVLDQLFRITRTWCYSIHRTRLKLLGRWHAANAICH